MTFKEAINAVNGGRKVRRNIWGRSMLYISKNIFCYLYITTENYDLFVYLPALEDMIATDWEIVE